MAKNERASIPEKQRYFLWARSAGRCHFCNQLVYEDWFSFERLNIADVAHIIGSSSSGPRGDGQLSSKLAINHENLMLLCKIHHKLVDDPDFEEQYPPERLREIKKQHEDRIEMLTSILYPNRTHVLLYGANIGKQSTPVNYNAAKLALAKNGKFPADREAIIVNVAGSYMTDDRVEFWQLERANLNHAFNTLIRERIGRSEISHLSVFALAPIPLLIELGSLLTDKAMTEVYQLLREPAGWEWQEKLDDDFDYIIEEPSDFNKAKVALNLSFSGMIPDADIIDTLGDDTAIWKVTIPTVHNDFLKTKEQLGLFRQRSRKLFDRMKEVHGRQALIHLFPAIPVAIAVEVGRIWMPKADLAILIYDRNHSDRRFSPAFQIG